VKIELESISSSQIYPYYVNQALLIKVL